MFSGETRHTRSKNCRAPKEGIIKTLHVFALICFLKTLSGAGRRPVRGVVAAPLDKVAPGPGLGEGGRGVPGWGRERRVGVQLPAGTVLWGPVGVSNAALLLPQRRLGGGDLGHMRKAPSSRVGP